MSWELAAGDRAQRAPAASSGLLRRSSFKELTPIQGASEASGANRRETSHHSLQQHSCPVFPPQSKSCSSWDEAGELLHRFFCPSLCSLHVCKNEAKKWNHTSSIKLHLFPLKYHSGQYLPVTVNPRSHLSLAHGKLCWV